MWVMPVSLGWYESKTIYMVRLEQGRWLNRILHKGHTSVIQLISRSAKVL